MASWIPAALDVVLNRWDSRSGFIVTLVILVFSLLVTFAGIDITKVQPIEWLVIALSCLALYILWWRTRRPGPGSRERTARGAAFVHRCELGQWCPRPPRIVDVERSNHAH